MDVMATGANSCYPNMYSLNEDATVVLSSSMESSSTAGLMDSHSSSLLYNLSLLKDKVHQLQSLATTFISQNRQSMAIHNMGNLLQEIIITASSMMFTCQNMNISLSPTPGNNPSTTHDHINKLGSFNAALSQPNYSDSTTFDWCGTENYGPTCNTSNNNSTSPRVHDKKSTTDHQVQVQPKNYDIIEMEVADLLAKYTHYCQVCGKGFKRDANLRMHMRAHGDEYKSTAALSNPTKLSRNRTGDVAGPMRKYSCPQEGCRWNRKHAKFTPLKSMICMKNHYKRSHCPKMYVCKRCNQKQFSVLSDLRTHEKHCGDVKWQCSCGTTFSRKDKLIGHVALFIGHTPAVHSSSMSTKEGRNVHQ